MHIQMYYHLHRGFVSKVMPLPQTLLHMLMKFCNRHEIKIKTCEAYFSEISEFLASFLWFECPKLKAESRSL